MISADEAGNIVFFCKAHYIHCIFKKKTNLDLILQVTIQLIFVKDLCIFKKKTTWI